MITNIKKFNLEVSKNIRITIFHKIYLIKLEPKNLKNLLIRLIIITSLKSIHIQFINLVHYSTDNI